MIEPLSPTVLLIYKRYWRMDSRRPARECCLGCPIKTECCQPIPDQESQVRRRAALNAAAERVQL